MKLRHLLFLAVALLTFSCGGDEKDESPQPNNPELNDNAKISADWIVKNVFVSSYDSLNNFIPNTRAGVIFSDSAGFYRFKSNGAFEEAQLMNGSFLIHHSGTYTLKGNYLTIDLPSVPTTHSLNIKSGHYFVDTLTINQLVFSDTVYNVIGPQGVEIAYSIIKHRAYK